MEDFNLQTVAYFREHYPLYKYIADLAVASGQLQGSGSKLLTKLHIRYCQREQAE